MNVRECTDALYEQIAKIYIGKKDKIRLILMAVFAGGHVLLDDLPGSGKTTLIKTLARALGCEMKRIQFTPDLLPSDITGLTVFNRNTSAFEQVKGPVFTNLLLADEINRAIPRTQAALLEAMEEHQVTIDNQSYELPEPFLVMATQNPVERESTFALPAAQMDRFFIRLSLGFPDPAEEVQMLTELGDFIDYEKVREVTRPAELLALRQEIRDIHVSDEIREYIVSLVQSTRNCAELAVGASPRSSRSLFRGGKCIAAMSGRAYVVPEDIQTVFLPVVSHRIILSPDARYTGKTPEEILSGILEQTPVPPLKDTLFYEKYRQ